MGSVGSPISWAPYQSYRDCSQGICSIYCPRWCYIIYPPPPPFVADDNSGTNFSPLIIAVISILASAFLLVTYYLIISKYCRRRGDQNPFPELEANRNQMNQDQWQLASTGLDEELIKSITVCKYKKGDGLVEGTDCAVCLSEFQEDERLRLLPECSHAFHLPCIDTWLKSHSNCPLCRANIVSSNPLPPPPQSIESYSNLNMSASQIQHRNDLVLVVDDPERARSEEVVVSDAAPKNMAENGQEQFRRSISLDSIPCQGHLLVADILHMKEDDDENIEMEIHQLPMGNGSSEGIWGENSIGNNGNGFYNLVRSRAEMKRSISTGRFTFTRHNKGKSSIIPS